MKKNSNDIRRSSVEFNILRALFLLPGTIFIYSLVLHTVYVKFVVVQFGYVGYQYVPTSVDVSVLSWIIATLPAVFLPRRAKTPSSVLLWVLYIVVVAPTVLTQPYMGTMDEWTAVGFSALLSAAFIVSIAIANRRVDPRPLRAHASLSSFWLIVGLFTLITYLYIGLTTGISLRFLSILSVYDQRADYREALAESTLLGYLVSNQANVVNPLLISWGVKRRYWPMVILVVIAQFVLYTATGFKTVLFSLLAIALLLVIFRISKRPRLIVLLWGAMGMVIAAGIIDRANDSILLTSLFSRRFLFTPSRLSGLYFEWYSNNPLSMLANSVLSPFIQSHYEYGPARTIAIFATGAPDSSLNANIFAAGFAEFGYFGLVGVAVLLGMYLRVLDRAGANLPVWFTSTVAVMPAITLSNTALHTAVLSHGLAAAVLLLIVVPRNNVDSDGLIENADEFFDLKRKRRRRASNKT